jgi:hypothetical protein
LATKEKTKINDMQCIIYVHIYNCVFLCFKHSLTVMFAVSPCFRKNKTAKKTKKKRREEKKKNQFQEKKGFGNFEGEKKKKKEKNKKKQPPFLGTERVISKILNSHAVNL